MESHLNFEEEEEALVDGGEPTAETEVFTCLELKDVPAIVQMEEMLTVLSNGNKGQQKRLVEACFILLCCVVGDDIGVDSDPNKSPSLWDQAAVKIISAITSVPKKDYERDNFMQYLPGKKWPDSFQVYVDALSGKQPTDDFRTKHSKLSENLLRLRFFGKHVMTTYLDTKAIVNNQWNPHWKPSVLEKSGSTPAKVFYAIREYCFDQELVEKAKSSLANAKKYRLKQEKKGGVVKNPIIFTDEWTEEMEIEKRIREARESSPFNPQEFPAAWPVFVLYGKPADPNHRFDSFIGGNASAKRALTMDSIKELKHSIPSKAARRSNEPATPKSATSSVSENFTPNPMVLVVRREESSKGVSQYTSSLVQAYAQKVKVLSEMKNLGIPVTDSEMKQAYENLSRALDAQADEIVAAGEAARSQLRK